MRGGVGQNQKSKTWFVMYDVPRGPDDKRKQVKKGGFKTEQEAKRYRRLMLSQIDAGLYVPTESGTTGHFLMDEYLPTQVHLRSSTLRTYTGYLSNRIVPAIGSVPLSDLRPAHLQRFYAELSASGLTPMTIRHVHAILRRAFNRAVDWGKLPVTPVRGLDLPTPPRRDLLTWSPAETRTFLAALHGDRDEALFTTLLTTGLRRGELLGLRWQDVDPVPGVARIEQALVQSGGHIALGPPKTRRSERVVALDRFTLTALRQHRQRQVAEQLSWGPGYVDSGLVFRREDGSHCIPSSVSGRWLHVQQGLGLPRLRLHDARHTHATLALEAGVPLVVVSERLGHSTITLTANTYGHVRPEVAREAADKVAGLLFE